MHSHLFADQLLDVAVEFANNHVALLLRAVGVQNRLIRRNVPHSSHHLHPFLPMLQHLGHNMARVLAVGQLQDVVWCMGSWKHNKCKNISPPLTGHTLQLVENLLAILGRAEADQRLHNARRIMLGDNLPSEELKFSVPSAETPFCFFLAIVRRSTFSHLHQVSAAHVHHLLGLGPAVLGLHVLHAGLLPNRLRNAARVFVEPPRVPPLPQFFPPLLTLS